MTPNEYQAAASRTICPQRHALKRIEALDARSNRPTSGAKLLHSVLGLTGEVGELAGAIEKYAYYNQDFDDTNIIEEIGDCLWYLAEMCGAMDVDMEEVMRRNIAKLRHRFPEKYTDSHAEEDNRDRAKEAEIVGRSSDPAFDDLYNKLSRDAEKRYNKAADDGVDYE